jgi:hypothetical protein
MKDGENAKLLAPRGLREKGPSLLTLREVGEKNPCLPAKLALREAVRKK